MRLIFDLNKLIEYLLSINDDKYKTFQSRMLRIDRKNLIGVRVPILRKISEKYKNLTVSEIDILLKNDIHDLKFLALLLLIQKFNSNKDQRKDIVDFYLNHTEYINNWDLVDLSSHKIIGNYFNSDNSIFDKLSFSDNVWELRIAIVASLSYIKNNNFSLTLKLAERYLSCKQSTIHKSTGWMLREVGKRNQSVLIDFLNKFYKKMPRVMLRYSVEKLPSQCKTKYFY